jgi:hypothetical protein
MSLILEQLDRDIVTTKKQIQDLTQDVETAKNSADPMPLMHAKSALQSAVSRLSVLVYRRKCETPAGGGGGDGPVGGGGGYFTGSHF